MAISLANYGLDAHFATKLPAHEIGESAISTLRKYGVGTDYIARGGERLGIYFLEHGASQRPSKVVYDRTNSSLSLAVSSDFDWDEIFSGAEWFHFTGITPALGDRTADLTLEALKAAKSHGVTVSVDLNYRKKLWDPKKAERVMSRLMEYVDISIGNEEDAEKIFGIKAAESNVTSGDLNEDGYREVAEKLVERFGVKKVAITLRESLSASENNWSALLYNTTCFYRSKIYRMSIVDRVGGGDSFAGGLIYGLINGKPDQEALEFAVAASCLKHSIFGDYNLVSVDEVERLVQGDASGRVQR